MGQGGFTRFLILVKSVGEPAPTGMNVNIPDITQLPITNYQLPNFMAEGLIAGLVVFTLASFVGFEVINKVPPTLHTPLMSGSNAISGIAVLGAILISGQGNVTVTSILGTIAIALATINVVAGFLVTDRMLQMFKKKEVKA